ncbi:MAG: ABC transporter substrate-binding protein [Candidatus Wallbacteria bacterium]|nr:ABC transporter substrate-binding protein [Candidatus Wallbacteria bacterium]
MRMKSIVAAAAAVLLGALVCAAPLRAEGETIKLGAVLPLTGGIAAFGMESKDGINLAVDEINAKGGVLGKKLEVLFEDDKGDPADTTNAVSKLINTDKVLAILGSVASSCTLAGAPVANSAKIPMITHNSTNDKVTGVGEYVFRTCFIDSFQGATSAYVAAKIIKAKTAALVTDVNSDYSKGLGEAFTAKFKELGGTITGEVSYQQNDVNFSSQLTKLKGTPADVIFIPGYYTEVALILKQAKQLKIGSVFLGADGWDDPKLLELAADAADGTYIVTHYSADQKTPEVEKLVKAYQDKYKRGPAVTDALAYDMVYVVADAMKRAGKADSQALRDALAATKDLKGATGSVTMNKDRNADKNAIVLKVEGGKMKFVESVKP